MIAKNGADGDKRQSWAEAIKAYGHPRVATMLLLGFSAGLPYMLIFPTLSTWLADVGVDLKSIGLASFIGLILAIKFLWAPLIDRTTLPILGPLLGRRRAWILFAQLFIVGGIFAMSRIDPATNLFGTMVAAIVVATALSTQDTAIDSWRIEAAGSDDRQATMAAAMLLGARFALLLSGAGTLYIATFLSWSTAYLIMAILMSIGILGTLFASPLTDELGKAAPKPQASLKETLYVSTVAPFMDFFARYGWTSALILATIGFYRMPDFLTAIMSNPFYISIGFTKAEIASVSKLMGVGAMILGTVLGGMVAIRIGVMRMLLLGVVLVSVTNLSYAWLATVGHNIAAMAVAVSLENLAGGFGGTALVAYMSSLTSRSYTATQYALLSCFIGLPGHILGGFSGYMVEGLGGFYWFFILTSATGIPGVILATLLIRKTRQQDALRAAEPAPEPALV